MSEKKTYDVELLFNIRAVTRGWTIEAESQEEAERLVLSCIDEHGELDDAKMTEVGLESESWDTIDGEGFEYELDTITESE